MRNRFEMSAVFVVEASDLPRVAAERIESEIEITRSEALDKLLDCLLRAGSPALPTPITPLNH